MKAIQSNRGFSLIELLIVVVVIGIISAVSIPNLLASRRAANEASALKTLRVTSGAEVMYYATVGNSNYATAAQLYNQGMIDRVVAAANNVNVGGNPARNTAKSGFRFRIQVTAQNQTTGTPASFVVSAVPSTADGVTQTGAKRLCLTESGLMKSATVNLASHYNYNQCNLAAAFKP